ncbi:Phox-like protein [Sodiomyces alkalinus F11]|uniref:Endosomal/vacuolar adapter protein YPT35 n=1 Tax=Sodiomyces alkalinus (strain CBS 110278 / VKM F-3762 / F11) TaxID=1314773 RepID=A0A3N2PKE6_SODAK|nr:Phox-like protein [Sodiomyces alkalinus F11]ROT34979.1 Phox-like protein [Sodiomyces alkalinus F11]
MYGQNPREDVAVVASHNEAERFWTSIATTTSAHYSQIRGQRRADEAEHTPSPQLALPHGFMDSAVDSEVPSAGSGLLSGGASDRRPDTRTPRPSETNGSSPLNGGNAADVPDHHASEDSIEPWLPETSTPASATAPPPYWSRSSSSNPHRRSPSNISNISTESSFPAGAITMRDNEASDQDERNKACWAKSVEITDYVVVNGSTTGIGAFVVWNGSFMNIRKRYSEFDELRHRLVMTFPNFSAAVPPLPPKSVISKFRPKFLDKRRQGLQYFLNCIMLNPEFSGSPVLKEFLFS